MAGQNETIRAVAGATLVVLVSAPSGLAQSVDYGPPIKTLRIAAWNLADQSKSPAGDAGGQAQSKPQRWRNTFGAERRSSNRLAAGASGLNADIIALQGVREIAEVRRLFPARTHNLVLSRAVLLSLNSSQDSRPAAAKRSSAKSFVTAIAVRRQPGVRVVGNHHFFVEAGGDNPNTQRLYTGLAIRLNVSRQPVWVTSVDLTRVCGVDEPASTDTSCDLHSAAERTVGLWTKRTVAAQIPVVLAGTYARALLKQSRASKSKSTATPAPA
ncbi:MAG: hypothetical protein ACR2PA_09255, partial [Hyphomicrobiaceae bacterium]